jgi:hypothetical protein
MNKAIKLTNIYISGHQEPGISFFKRTAKPLPTKLLEEKNTDKCQSRFFCENWAQNPQHNPRNLGLLAGLNS